MKQMRKIITIDDDRCTGCGLCVDACHEGAISLVNGKAKLMHEHYCDGLGDCLPACPENAISFEEREAEAYDEAAVQASMQTRSQLRQWPIQIKLAPVEAPYFNNADLLIAADCTAFAYGAFHRDFMQGKNTLIGCPKLDAVDYSEKLTQIFSLNDIKSVTVTRMIVPCCSGLENAVKRALEASQKDIPLSVVTFDMEGQIVG